MIAPAASSPATAGGHDAGREQHDHRRAARRSPPSRGGRAARPGGGRASGASTTSTSGSSSCSSSALHEPCSSSVSPVASSTSPGPSSSPLRCTASTTRSPLEVTMPGKTVSPISSERGGITTSATPDSRVKSVPATSSSRPYCSVSVRACWLKSAESRRGGRSGSSRSPKRTTIAIVPGDERHADERELEEAEPARARVVRGVRRRGCSPASR